MTDLRENRFCSQSQNNVTTSLPVCYPYPAHWGGAMTLLRFIVYYAVPLVVIGVLYALMARHLILSTKNMPGEQQGQARQIRARRKVAKTVLAFVVVFAVCFFPHHVFALWFHWCPTAHQDYNAFWHYFRIVGKSDEVSKIRLMTFCAVVRGRLRRKARAQLKQPF